VWPRTGWRRFFVYYVKRLTRLSGTPHNIAAGVACGAAISFTPFVGLHVVLGALLALIVRGNLLAMVAGTLGGNPWTFPFIWVATYEVGQFLLGGQALGALPVPWTFQELAGYISHAAREAATVGPVTMVKHLAADLSVVAWPMMVGGVPLGLAAGLVTYFPLLRVVAAYQHARQRRREHRRQREQRRRHRVDAALNPAGAPTDAGVG
jgi:uncharacterized protein (DUF2062 family)